MLCHILILHQTFWEQFSICEQYLFFEWHYSKSEGDNWVASTDLVLNALQSWGN